MGGGGGLCAQVELDKGVFVIRYSMIAPPQPHAAFPFSAAQLDAPCTVVCSAVISQTFSKRSAAGMEAVAGSAAEEKAVKDSKVENAKDAEETHTQLARRKGPADYVTVDWKDAEEDTGIDTD